MRRNTVKERVTKNYEGYTSQHGEEFVVETSRKKLIGEKTPKDFGIRRTKKLRDFFFAKCDHANKRGKPDCKQKFSGWTVDLVMGNKAIHEQWHDQQDRKLAQLAAVN